MNLSNELTKQVTDHLDEVRKYLGNLPADERQEILQSIESHIYDALQSRSDGEPTPALLDAVIAEMDPPESYGELPTPPQKKKSRRKLIATLCGLALVTLAITGTKWWPTKNLNIIGRWVSVDFVETIDQFDPKVISVTADFPLKKLTFLPNGKTDNPFWTWADEYLIRSEDYPSAKLVIKRISGEDYLFLEWISGDVTMRRQKPQYYVLKRGEYSSQPIKTQITEGVGWENYVLGKTSGELIQAMGEPKPNTPDWMMRWDRHPHIDVALSDANTCREVRFNRGFTGQTACGIKLGSSFQEMLEAYGDAERTWASTKHSAVVAQWPSKGIYFYTYQGHVSQIIICKPRPKHILPFEDDPIVHGQWISVDFIKSIRSFDPAKQAWTNDLFLKELTFHPDGTTSHEWTWTKGRLISEESLSSYTIKEIDGEDYLFTEWMSGDVTLRGQPPKYYVLKRANSEKDPSPQLKPVAFEQGLNTLENGDAIILDEILATSPNFAIGDIVTAKGQHTLASQLNANILLTVTATRGSGRSNVEKEQKMKMTLGSGEFELTYTIPFHGCSQLSFRDEITGESLGGLYFGTKKQVDEMKALKKMRPPRREKKPTVESPNEKSKSINLTNLPSKADMEKISEMQRAKAQERMWKDREIYSQDERVEIESLYQVANKKWRSEEGKDSLKELISKYSSANRTGCALLYLGQMSTGDEQIEYLRRAINNFSDCFYGDGVQVGAYARFVLFHRYKKDGENEKAAKLAEEIKTLYPESISHRKQSLVFLLEAAE